VLLADRGYGDVRYLRCVPDAGGFFLIRAKAGMHPQVIEALRADGHRLRSLRHKPLKVLSSKLPKRQRVERVVGWQVDGHPLCLRLIISWHRRTRRFCSVLTNLAPQRDPLDPSGRAYKWRWQVELLVKAWQSYANPQAFDTPNAVIVEGWIWVAMAAAALQRFLAHLTQVLLEVPMSTRTVARCAMYVLGDGVEALQRGDRAGRSAALEAAMPYLACQAQRAHPARDRHIGRSQLGLEPLFGSGDVIEFAEAA
jgi:Transposase DDE domain